MVLTLGKVVGCRIGGYFHDDTITPIGAKRRTGKVTPLLPLQWVRLDYSTSFLLSGCDETAPLDRHFKGPGNSRCRLFSLFQHLLPTWRASAASLEQPRNGCADDSAIDLVQSVGPRIPCGRSIHHLERLDADAIDDASR